MVGMTGERSGDGRLTAPSAERNKGPILAVLRRFLPERGLVLEIASGTGQHVVHYAEALPSLAWQPTDINAEHLASIAAWIRHAGLSNVRAPIALDVGGAWPDERFDALICCNMIHIAPWQATLDLMRGASKTVVPGGVLFLYGPYKRFGRHTAPSNEQFDLSLQARNPDWGLRDMETVIELAATSGFDLAEIVEMPANNFSVVFRRRAG